MTLLPQPERRRALAMREDLTDSERRSLHAGKCPSCGAMLPRPETEIVACLYCRREWPNDSRLYCKPRMVMM